MEWRSATIEDVSRIVEHDLMMCGSKQTSAFIKYKVAFYIAPISRYGNNEGVVVVARRNDEVIYWEDVEEGFNRSLIGPDGRILEHGCNQDDLCLALCPWVDHDEN